MPRSWIGRIVSQAFQALQLPWHFSSSNTTTMRLSWLLSLPAVLTVASALAIEKRDADFLSVRTKMHKDMSGRRGDPKDKYFRKSLSQGRRTVVCTTDRFHPF